MSSHLPQRDNPRLFIALGFVRTNRYFPQVGVGLPSSPWNFHIIPKVTLLLLAHVVPLVARYFLNHLAPHVLSGHLS